MATTDPVAEMAEISVESQRTLVDLLPSAS